MITWPLDRQGYVCHYMAAGPMTEPLGEAAPAIGQLRGEIWLRERIARHEPVDATAPIRAGENGRLGCPWRFVGGRDGAFVNLSAFYPRICRARFDAVADIVSPADMTVDAVVWSFAAVDVYLNGARLGGIERPAYKPISRAALKLRLRAGENRVYMACETLGVRDTRSIVALQIPAGGEALRVALPDASFAGEVAPALAFLEDAAPEGNQMRFARPAPRGTLMSYQGGSEPDYAKARIPTIWRDVSGLESVLLRRGEPWVTLEISIPGGALRRRYERTEQVAPQRVLPVPGFEENRLLIMNRIADVESLNRDGAFGFPIANLIARRALGRVAQGDSGLFEDMLALIEQRVDCADFLVCGLLRYLKSWPVEGELAQRVRHALTGFRYWMDMDGADGMCFWSENHSLMFYIDAMLAGELYPDDWFPLAKRSGRKLTDWGRERVEHWLDDVEANGFEEFLSGVYMCVTFAALLNVIDYGGEVLSARAARVADGLLGRLALHAWKGGFIAPMGRTYREALYPFAQGVMALVNLIDPAQPWSYGEGWLGFLANSRYRIPEDLKKLIDAPAGISYVTGNARVTLEKHEDWCLTSVACPGEPFRRWENTALDGAAGEGDVKSWNERFHGTTCFQPGVYGYQQHLWYAALDGAAVVFVNHPGATSEDGDMRPGYWHGNGVFPALMQRGNMLGMIYRIPREHPIHFIHAYVPECRFDEVICRDNWLFLRRGAGYIGLWTSVPMEPWEGLNRRCERRAWGSDIAALCVCGGRDYGTMADFIGSCTDLGPVYDSAIATLTAGDFALAYRAGEDRTQYL